MSPKTFSQDEQGNSGAYPAEWIEQATLRDGLRVTIRPIQPADAQGLQEGFKYLSAQSIYMRFLGTVTQLSEEQARNYATLDYQNRMAFVACVVNDGKEIVIGVARYAVIDADEPGLAECAVVVGDVYQGRGLGLRLLDQLIRYARSHRVTKFLATVHSTNSQIKRFIERSGFKIEKKMLEPGVWEIRLQI